MADTEKIPTPQFLIPGDAVTVLKKIVAKVEKDVWCKITMSPVSSERLVICNTINNVFDRIDEAIEKYQPE